MSYPRIALALAMVFAAGSPALAGKFNKALSIGDAAPAWKGLPGTDGKEHSLADFKGKDVVVVTFTCNSCPVAEGYERRMIAFAKAFAGPDAKVGFVAINVNTTKEDALPAMRARAVKRKYPFPYLYDPSQEIARKFGARFTPEFFVLDKGRKVVYMGSMDDRSPPREPKVKYLEEAVKAALAGQKPGTTETSPAAGCGIKFNRKNDD